MDNTFLYINLDGFGWYYYQQIKDKEKTLPNLSKLIAQGTLFSNAYTGIPSITFPMQCAIVSGCYSNQTGNCYQYWDRESNQIKTLFRYNQAQTIGEMLYKHNIPFVSIQQFALEEKGATKTNKNFLYVQPGGNYKKRFAILQELLINKRIQTDTQIYVYEKLPQAIFLYIDDLDTIGHNPPAFYTFSETKRIENVQKRLIEIDIEFGKLIQTMKQLGMYDRAYILLTTDHGMVSYKAPSKIKTLIQALESFGAGKAISCKVGDVSSNDFDILLTSHGIQCQLYFKNKCWNQQELKEKLLTLPYVEQVLTSEELKKRGTSSRYADMLISPIEGESFSVTKLLPMHLYATHDSLHEKCQHIFAVIKGPKIKKNYIETEKVYNIDFIPTLCKIMGLPKLKHSQGKYLKTIERM